MKKALILDGSSAGDATGERVARALASALAARGVEGEVVTLRECRIGACAGDFGCWLKHPGVCMTEDDNRRLTAAVINSDLVAYLGPITFGGWAPQLKRLIDHQIQNISPLFLRVDGETHHRKRYPHYPDLLAVGWQDGPNPGEAETFTRLVARNAINFHASASVAALIDADDHNFATEEWLDALERGERVRVSGSPVPPGVAGVAPERAVLLVGSPRLRSSSSYALGRHLLDRLEAAGIQTSAVMMHPAARSAGRTAALIEQVDAADLVLLAAPLYVDGLPAPALEVMASLQRHSQAHARRKRLAAIVNSGFPEAAQNHTALAIAAHFADRSGWEWAGGLAIGGGEGLIHGVAPSQAGGRARPVVAALDVSAAALADGKAIPAQAVDLAARSVIPAWLYRAVGTLGWRSQARANGAASDLAAQPYLASH